MEKFLILLVKLHYSVPTQFLNSKSFTLALTAKKSNYIFPVSEQELSGLSPNFHIHVSVSAYIPMIGPPFFLQQNRQRPIVVIYVLTET
jgi:hypothetical protein